LVSFYALGFTDPTAASEDWVGVRELAAHYVQLISKEQRHGPYFLGGYSYGGLVAYEMASLLTEQNQRVECVAMIDTFPWSPLSQKISTRVVSMQEDGNSQRRHVKVRERRSHSSLKQMPFPVLNDHFRCALSRYLYNVKALVRTYIISTDLPTDSRAGLCESIYTLHCYLS